MSDDVKDKDVQEFRHDVKENIRYLQGKSGVIPFQHLSRLGKNMVSQDKLSAVITLTSQLKSETKAEDINKLLQDSGIKGALAVQDRFQNDPRYYMKPYDLVCYTLNARVFAS